MVKSFEVCFQSSFKTFARNVCFPSENSRFVAFISPSWEVSFCMFLSSLVLLETVVVQGFAVEVGACPCFVLGDIIYIIVSTTKIEDIPQNCYRGIFYLKWTFRPPKFRSNRRITVSSGPEAPEVEIMLLLASVGQTWISSIWNGLVDSDLLFEVIFYLNWIWAFDCQIGQFLLQYASFTPAAPRKLLEPSLNSLVDVEPTQTCSMLAACCWILDAGYLLLLAAAGYLLLLAAAGCLLLLLLLLLLSCCSFFIFSGRFLLGRVLNHRCFNQYRSAESRS